MTIQRSDIESRSGPKYIAITEALADSIRNGSMKPGERLPTHRDLADTLGVTVATITRAYKEAIACGLISGEVGRGSFVRDVIREQDTLQEHFPANSPRDDLPAINSDMESSINLGPILPAQGNQDRLLADTLKSIAESPDLIKSALPYIPQPGLLEHHQQAGAQWLSQWIPDIDPSRVVATTGAQYALSLAVLASAGPGEVILAENMAWFGIKAIASSFNVGIEAVPMDEDGLIPKALERACAAHNPRVVFCASNCQNPTTASMPLERRRAIVDIARRYNLTIIEDGVFDFFAEDSIPSLAELAPERTIYVTSFSKCIGASLRTGFMYVPEALFPRVSGLNRALLICMAPLMLDIASSWILEGTANQLVDWQRAEFAERRKLARAAFDGLADIRSKGSWLWLELPEPWTPGQYVAAAAAQGITVWASEQFMIGRTAAPPVVRISLGGYGTREYVASNLQTLAHCLTGEPSAPMIG